ncbi:MAG: methyltransferase domain-containing protein [Patescibacteria group bacterium]|nr:methyltransferase domain-containing protein [Patescibacteria group bacterium]
MNQKKALQIIRKTGENYNKMAREWSVSRDKPSALKINLVKKIIRPRVRALDLGCGNGFLLPEILSRKGDYIGMDNSRELLRAARKKYPEHKNKFIKGEAGKLPFKNKTFDAVFSFAVLHHIPSEKYRLKFFQEIFRVLKSGGESAITVWNLLNEWPKEKYKIAEQLKKIVSGLEEGDVFVPWKASRGKKISRYIHLFKKEELKNLAKKAGFKIIKIDYFNRAGQKEKNGEELVLLIKK